MEKNVIIKYNGKTLFQRAEIKTPFTLNNEGSDYACFFYLSKGNCELLESHGSLKIYNKQALLKTCGTYIARFNSNEFCGKVECIMVHFHPEIIQEVYSNLTDKFLKKQKEIIKPKKIIAKELIEKYINNLIIYFDNPSLIDEDLAILKFKELVMILIKTEDYANFEELFSTLFNPNKLKFKTIIENNIYNNISMEELAFLTNKSLSSFKRFFKATYQESPAKYIKQKRFEKASKLLARTNDLVSDVAYQCGFQDPSSFSSSFHSFFGQSPTRFRKSQIL